MASGLITLLTENLGKTPDEIVRKLSNRGWRRPSEISRKYFEENKETTPHYYWCQHLIDGTSGARNVREHWVFGCCSHSYDEFVASLETRHRVYWLIPANEYTGEPPPC